MEQQRERTSAFLLLTMPQPYARDLGCATTLSTSTRSGRTGWLLSVFRSQCSIIWTVQSWSGSSLECKTMEEYLSSTDTCKPEHSSKIIIHHHGERES